MKKLYLLKYTFLLMIILSALVVNAQTGTVSGKVIDETGSTLPGATILLIGTTSSTMTDANGNFKITGLSGTVKLSVNYIGYKTFEQTLTVGANTIVNIKLEPDNQKLNEVVVIGYGTAQKKDLTGAISTVTSKDFQKGPVTSPEQLIQGKVAGVSIIRSGGPFSGSQIRIRGGASLNASNDPLIVVDGVPFSGDGIGNAPSPLILINPDDIETFTILKDANATAIYGSRASNGVILITTKKGSAGGPVITLNSMNSVGTVAKKVDVLSADQIRNYVNTNGSTAQKALLGNAKTDWQDEIFQNSFSTDNVISISGTFKDVPYRVSGGYLDQSGVLITDKLRRATGAITISPKFFNNHLKVNLNLKGSLTDSHFGNNGAIGSALLFDPTQTVKANNNFGGYYEWLQGNVPNPNAPRNPVALIKLQDNNGKSERSFGNIQFDYSFHFLPELHANLNLGYDVSKGYGATRVPTFAAQSNSTQGFYGDRYNTSADKFSEFYLNYSKAVESINSKFDVTAGYGYYDNSSTNYGLQTFKGTGEILTTPTFPFSVEQNKLLSYYGRFVYTLADKYIFSGTMRADASSRFAEKDRWGYFPSAGFTWRIIGEDFLKNSEVVSDLKLRLSYGETGNKDGIGNYNYLPKYYNSSNNGQYQVGNTFYNYYSPAAYDPDLKWETTTTYNAGLDYGFANGKFYGSIDAYYKKTKDLLSTVNIPIGTNFSNLITTNVGNMDVRGIEASLNVVLLKNENSSWEMGVNAAYNQRKITNLTLTKGVTSPVPAGTIAGGTGTVLKYNAVNQIPGAYYVYKQVYNADGKPLEGVYADLNNDGLINTDDQYFYKSADPKVTIGYTSQFTYKKLTISTALRANIGNYVYDNVSSALGIKTNILNPAGIINNTVSDFLFTNFQSNQYLSDYYLKNATFLKMDNASVSYNFGKISTKGTAKLSVSANCQNVFTVSKYKGLDPEIASGIDYNIYPRARTYSLGVNVGF